MARNHDLPIFLEPQCLIETNKDGKLSANLEIMKQMETLDSKMVVVAIAGLYRSGKSYLMNRLAGKSAGFALGSTIQSKTKGIWIWVRPHPMKKETYLVLMDTEGLGDAEKGDPNHDNWIFTLSTLLSSTLVYNFLGAINDDMITKLHFVTEISKRIKTRSGDDEQSDDGLDIHFPLFVMALRDFCLDLEINGQEVSADQYLEHLLNLGNGKSKEFIESRRCIRKYFKTRRCFTFDRPTSRRKLKNLENLQEAELGEDFLENSKEFTDFVFRECPAMKLPNGHNINGAMFVSLVESYLESIREGVVPCVENAFTMMATLENHKVLEASIRLYQDLLDTNLQLPTETEGELSKVSIQCQKKVISYFASKVIMDANGSFQKHLHEELLKIYTKYDSENRNASKLRCQELLNLLEMGMKQKLQKGKYTQPGGFEEYTTDLEHLKQAYRKHQGLGAEKERMIDDYIHTSTTTTAAILAADEKMTEDQKKIEDMKQQTFIQESQRKRDEEEIRHLQQLAQENVNFMEETKQQMEEKHQDEMSALKKQQKEIHEKRINEQKRLITEGFKKEAEQMRKEIEHSKQQFSDEQKHLQEAVERERQHQQEMMEAKLREQQQEHALLLELEKQKAENDRKEERLKMMDQAARESHAEYEAMMERFATMNHEHMDAMERMHQENLKAQFEQQKVQRDLEVKRMEQEMERNEIDAERQKEARDKLIEVERRSQQMLEEERNKRQEMEADFRKQHTELQSQITKSEGGDSICLIM